MIKHIQKLIILILLLIVSSFSFNVKADAGVYPKILTFGAYGVGDEELQNPYGIDVDEASGDIYIADTGNSKIKKFNRFGEYLNSFGIEGTADGEFRAPQGVALDRLNNDIYVADTANHRIQKFQINGTFILKFGSEGTGNGQFILPRDIEVDSSGNVYVCDSGNNRISKFDSSGNWIGNSGQSASLLRPYGLDLDDAGNIYIADTYNHRVVKLAPDGTLLMQFGAYGNRAGEFIYPRDVAVDDSGNIYVADTVNYRIQKFDSTGAYINSFGVFIEFLSPQKIAIDSDYKLHVVDSNTNRIQVYDVISYITNVYADPNSFSPDGDGFVDTTSIHYTIPEPARITITIYDTDNNLIRDLITDAERVTDKNKEVWDGRDNSGIPVNAGVYTFKIDAVNALNYHPPQQSGAVSVIYPAGQISGTVTDGTDPIQGAVVSDGLRLSSTDSNGDYTIINVPAGIYIVTASKSGCTTASQVVGIAEGEVITGIDFSLDCTNPVHTLAVDVTGTGNGTVESSPAGIDCGADCTEAYDEGTTVTLTATPDAGSYFTGWSGGGCSGTSDCTVTMNADTDVTATFSTCTNLPVRITGATPVYYSTLQNAYDAAVDGDIIQSQTARFIEDLNINRNISVTLEGGYDCGYTAITGKTMLTGDITITDGTAVIGNFVLEQSIYTPNNPPTADPGGPYTGIEGEAIILDSLGSTDTDGSIVLYEWDIDNDGIYDYSSSLPFQSHTYAQQGTYTIKLRVTDNLGATDEALTTADISDTSPTADFTGFPTTGIALLTVDFTNNSTGYDQPLSYEWDFDNDGIIDSTGQNPSYIYTDIGIYTVKLTVTDFDGSINTLIRTDYITATLPVYTLTVNINGNGMVTSSPAGIDCGADCTEQYAPGIDVTLTATPDAGSYFAGWSGGSCSGTGCTVTMNADTTVTAAFSTCTNLPVRIAGATPVYYSTLQNAYDAAVDEDIIQSQTARFIEDLNINRSISVTLEGGYDCGYTAITGKTMLTGDITITDGTVTIGNFLIEQ